MRQQDFQLYRTDTVRTYSRDNRNEKNFNC